MKLKDITKEAVVVKDDALFSEALEKMIGEQTNTLLVVNSDGELVGEINVSNLLDAIVPEYLDGDSIAAHFATEEMFKEAVKDAADQPVSSFMTTDFEAVKPDEGLMTVAANAIAHQKAHIPVVDEQNHPVGVISRRGLKHILARFLHNKNGA